MKYTVKQLARLSGVTSRTLRYYDEIGLLKPACKGEDNQYRYYGETELLTLQHILFFRALGFSLNHIKTMLMSNNFDKLDALSKHKVALKKEIEKMQTLITTVDKTLLHLKREVMMKDIEMFDGFDMDKLIEYENYLKDKCPDSEAILDGSWVKAKDLSKTDWDTLHQAAKEINIALVDAILKGLKPEDETFQAIIQKHYDWICVFWVPNADTYVGLSKMYQDHHEFRAFYTEPHPELLAFIVKGMAVFATKLA